MPEFPFPTEPSEEAVEAAAREIAVIGGAPASHACDPERPADRETYARRARSVLRAAYAVEARNAEADLTHDEIAALGFAAAPVLEGADSIAYDPEDGWIADLRSALDKLRPKAA